MTSLMEWLVGFTDSSGSRLQVAPSSCLRRMETHSELTHSQHLYGHYPSAVIIILPGKCNGFWTGFPASIFAPLSSILPYQIQSFLQNVNHAIFIMGSKSCKGSPSLSWHLTSVDLCLSHSHSLSPLGLPYSLLSQHTGFLSSPRLLTQGPSHMLFLLLKTFFSRLFMRLAPVYP